jgi:hypothetical protein
MAPELLLDFGAPFGTTLVGMLEELIQRGGALVGTTM